MSKRVRASSKKPAPAPAPCALDLLLHDMWRVIITECLTTADTLCLMDAWPEVRFAVDWPGKPRNCDESTRQLYASGSRKQVWFFRKHLHGCMAPSVMWQGYLRSPRFSGAAVHEAQWVDMGLPRRVPTEAYPAVVDYLLGPLPLPSSKIDNDDMKTRMAYAPTSNFFTRIAGLDFATLLRFPDLVTRLVNAWRAQEHMDVLDTMRFYWKEVARVELCKGRTAFSSRITCPNLVSACVADFARFIKTRLPWPDLRPDEKVCICQDYYTR